MRRIKMMGRQKKEMVIPQELQIQKMIHPIHRIITIKSVKVSKQWKQRIKANQQRNSKQSTQNSKIIRQRNSKLVLRAIMDCSIKNEE